MFSRLIFKYKKIFWEISKWFSKSIVIKTPFFKLEVSTKDDVIGRNFYYYGSYGVEEIQTAVTYLQQHELFRKSVFLDIGSNIGFMSLYILSKDYAHHAICIEPDPINYRLIERNFRHNKLTQKYTGYNLALASKPEKGKLILSKNNHGDHRMFTENEIREKDKYNEDNQRPIINIQVDTLDNIVNSTSFTEVSLVCMDVQGFELEVLKGGRRVFGASPMMIEIDPYLLEKKGCTVDALSEELARNYTHFVDIGNTMRQNPIEEFKPFYDDLKRSSIHKDLLMISKGND